MKHNIFARVLCIVLAALMGTGALSLIVVGIINIIKTLQAAG